MIIWRGTIVVFLFGSLIGDETNESMIDSSRPACHGRDKNLMTLIKRAPIDGLAPLGAALHSCSHPLNLVLIACGVSGYSPASIGNVT